MAVIVHNETQLIQEANDALKWLVALHTGFPAVTVHAESFQLRISSEDRGERFGWRISVEILPVSENLNDFHWAMLGCRITPLGSFTKRKSKKKQREERLLALFIDRKAVLWGLPEGRYHFELMLGLPYHMAYYLGKICSTCDIPIDYSGENCQCR